MNKCSEFVLDDLMAITAIPVTKINYDANRKLWPASMLTPTVSVDYTVYFDSDTIVIGNQRATKNDNAVGTLIPIIKMTGKAKDAESDSVAGRQHTVTVSCEVDDRDGSVWDYLLDLERIPSHLLLTFRMGTRAFVAATRDTYLCEVERDGAKTSVIFKVNNLMGIQLITE